MRISFSVKFSTPQMKNYEKRRGSVQKTEEKFEKKAENQNSEIRA
jgi:hypothetical protein